MPKIFYRSRPILILPPRDEPLCDGEIDGFRVVEQTEERGRCATDPRVMYWVYIEADAETIADAAEVLDAASGLIEDLERVWVYAMGEPMRAVRTVMQLYHGPEGWETNFKEVNEQLQAKESGLTGKVSITNCHWIRTPHWPLAQALAALRPYRSGDELTRTLIELHFDALRSTRREGRLFFLAKGLEIVRDLLPGHTIEKKERSLQASARKHLTKPLNWLYDMSNNRADTRHVVRPRATNPTLHPKMTAAELKEYERNADIVIREVVSQRLGIDCAIVASA